MENQEDSDEDLNDKDDIEVPEDFLSTLPIPLSLLTIIQGKESINTFGLMF